MFIAIALIVGLIFTGFCAFGAIMYRKKLRLLRSVELSDVCDLDEGPGKVYGTVIAVEEPITAPVSNVPCVYYSLMVEEEHVREETYTERVGNRTVRRRRTIREWHPLFTDVKYVSVSVKDDTGKAEVEFDKAELTIKRKGRNASGLVSNLSDKAVLRLERMYPKLGRAGKCRYTEVTIQEDDEILVMGEVSFLKGNRPLFAYEKKKPLIISDLSDEELQKHLKRTAMWLFIGAGFFLVATIVAVILIARK